MEGRGLAYTRLWEKNSLEFTIHFLVSDSFFTWPRSSTSYFLKLVFTFGHFCVRIIGFCFICAEVKMLNMHCPSDNRDTNYKQDKTNRILTLTIQSQLPSISVLNCLEQGCSNFSDRGLHIEGQPTWRVTDQWSFGHCGQIFNWVHSKEFYTLLHGFIWTWNYTACSVSQ